MRFFMYFLAVGMIPHNGTLGRPNYEKKKAVVASSFVREPRRRDV